MNPQGSISLTLARIVLPKYSFLPSTTLLPNLHWLPVTSCVKYKLAIITYKCLSVAQTTYLYSLFQQYEPGRTLCSADESFLALPPLTSDLADVLLAAEHRQCGTIYPQPLDIFKPWPRVS